MDTQITFDEFAALMGHTYTGDPALVVEAWEEFVADATEGNEDE